MTKYHLVKAPLNGAKKLCSKKQPCDGLTWSKTKTPEGTEK